MSAQRPPNDSTAAATSVRLLWALAACERLMQGTPGIVAGWALAHATRTHGVDRLALAELWLGKLLACQAAREHAASLDAADADERGKT